MKFLKGLLATFLILVIIGGIGYIGYSYFFMDMDNNNTKMSSNTSNNNQNSSMSGMSGMSGMGNDQNQQQSGTMDMSGNSGMSGMGNNQNQQQKATSNVNSLNLIAVENRNRLNEAVNKINEALDLITIDPYSKATVPSSSTMLNPTQQNTGSGTINIYPSGNSSLNIMPNDTTGNQSAQNMNNTPTNNYVYDQGKLQQLHNGIFALAQGVSTLEGLNNDLLTQSSPYNTNLSDYQVFMLQYYNALQNKAKLDNAISMINQATALINVNPYASQYGYAFNADAMGQMNRGVYALAQGMARLNELSQNFTKQMSDATTGVYSLSNGSPVMDMSNGMSSGFWGNISTATIINIVLGLFVIGLFAGIIGAVFNLFKPRNNPRGVI